MADSDGAPRTSDVGCILTTAGGLSGPNARRRCWGSGLPSSRFGAIGEELDLLVRMCTVRVSI